MKNKSIPFLFLFFCYGVYFGLFPTSFPEYTKCEEKELLRKGWNYVLNELPRAKPLVTNKCKIRIGNIPHLKATNPHYKKVIEMRFQNEFYKPLPVNKNGPEHLPSIWNEVG